MNIIKVVVVTDGLGSFQARCLHCDWRSKWIETGKAATREAKVVELAKQHGASHTQPLQEQQS